MSIKIKELFYNASYEYKRNRYACSDYLQSIEDDIGKEFIRNHFANDFRYFKVHKDSGEEPYIQSLSKITDILEKATTEQETVKMLKGNFRSTSI